VTNLHPALVLLALLIGAKAAQLTGTLLAIPVAVVVTTLIEEAQGRLAEPAAASGTSIHVELERT
jgi:predicted PurR-regulated permease PerM